MTERVSDQERRLTFEHYMRMDPARPADRAYMRDKCMALASSMFVDAQYLELLRNRLAEGAK